MIGMTIGETKDVTLTSDQAYGDHNPENVREVPKGQFPEDYIFTEGTVVQGSSSAGTPIVGTILKESGTNVMVDFNHPMAGKDLNFHIEVMSVEQGE